MRIKSRLRTTPEVPTASMADIAFLLIIFFMLTAVFTSTKGLEFAFPKEDPTQTNVQPEESIHIKIVGEGQFVVDRTPMSLQETGGYIQAKMQENPDKPVIIQTEGDVPYYVMVDVFDLLKALEVKSISIPTQSEVERWKAFGVFE
ncbi:MAG: ExbD/TolR family protein [Acidobacteriota bacterium]